MIRDINYENHNFEKSKSKLMNYFGIFDNVLEMNTKFHMLYSHKEQKELKKNYFISYMLADLIFAILFIYMLIFQKELFFVPVIIGYTFVIILGLLYQYLSLISLSYGSKENIDSYYCDVSIEEYFRFHEINLPLETLPDWICSPVNIYEKESFDKVINKFNTKQFKEFIKKYKRLAFKTNKVIENNKKILTSWLKKEKEGLILLDVKPLTTFDYKTYWKDLGFSDEQINKMYEEKILSLKQK